MSVAVSPPTYLNSIPTPPAPVQSTPAYATSMPIPNQPPTPSPTPTPMMEDIAGGGSLMTPSLMSQNPNGPLSTAQTYTAATASQQGAQKSGSSSIAIGAGVVGALAVGTAAGVWYHRRGQAKDEEKPLAELLTAKQRTGIWLKDAANSDQREAEQNDLKNAMLTDTDSKGLNYFFGQDKGDVPQHDQALNTVITSYAAQYGSPVKTLAGEREIVSHAYTALQDGKVVGVVSFKRLANSEHVNLAYWLASTNSRGENIRGTGLAKSLIATGVTRMLKADPDAKRVYAYVDRNNTSSNGLAENGLKFSKVVGDQRKLAVLPFEVGEHNLYSVTRDHWNVLENQLALKHQIHIA